MTKASHLLCPVILCGGSGTRLWPLSRETEPKQFLSLSGSTRSLLQDTVLRLDGLQSRIDGATVASTPVVVTNHETRFLVAAQLSEIGRPSSHIVLEPAGRNTAPALTLAALHARAEMPDSDPVLFAMPADHVIADREVFLDVVAMALPAACDGAVVTFGIVPDRPETGYGYIECSANASGAPAAMRAILAFVEKPDAATAERYLQDGRHLWNAGLFLLRCSTWLRALGQLCPDILAACEAAMQQSQRDQDFVRPHRPAFEACPPESIDYAVMERLPVRADLGIAPVVAPLQAGWNDVGAWDALHGVLPKDADGNAAVGEVLLHGTRQVLAFSSHRLVAAAGVSQLAIIETADAVMVVDLRQTQQVKTLVQQLKAEGHTLALSHRKVHRPWGWYDSLDSGDRFQVKRIQVNPGASLSLQLHNHRAEHWVVVKGTAEVVNGDETVVLHENESTYIPVGCKHRLTNPGAEPLEIIEVQTGAYLGEDDIVRFEDNFGRAG